MISTKLFFILSVFVSVEKLKKQNKLDDYVLKHLHTKLYNNNKIKSHFF